VAILSDFSPRAQAIFVWYNGYSMAHDFATDSVTAYRQEQELLKQYDPALVVAKPRDTTDVLRRAGIDIDLGFLPQGYLNFYHQDFIVEELGYQKKVCTIEPEGSIEIPPKPDGKDTLYFDLVKAGLSTIEAIDELARATGIPRERFNYSGIKDKVAVTSQQVSVNDADPSRFENLKVAGLFLKNFSWGKRNLYKGGLRGNQFTILVRTPATLGEGWLAKAVTTVRNGFYNFYYLQRFGAPRYHSHDLGRLLLQRDYEGTVRTYFADPGVQDVPLLNQLRQKIAGQFGDWVAVEQTMSTLPYTFRNELLMVAHLRANPTDYLGALQRLPDQLAMWIYAYASYLFNSHVSRVVNAGARLPNRLPLLLNPSYMVIDTYRPAGSPRKHVWYSGTCTNHQRKDCGKRRCHCVHPANRRLCYYILKPPICAEPWIAGTGMGGR
jgi:tRNA(Glu) U13 pseudouridine synthase TruD